MLAMKDLQNAPEAAAWKANQELEIGDTFFSLQGPPGAKLASDLSVQPFYPAQMHQPLGGFTDGTQIGNEMNDILQRTGHPQLRPDRIGPNIATHVDPDTMDITNTFFDPILNPRRASETPSAWRPGDVATAADMDPGNPFLQGTTQGVTQPPPEDVLTLPGSLTQPGGTTQPGSAP
jgi:hypothetical protein